MPSMFKKKQKGIVKGGKLFKGQKTMLDKGLKKQRKAIKRGVKRQRKAAKRVRRRSGLKR